MLAALGGPSAAALPGPAIPATERAETIARLRSRKRLRPVIALVADNRGAETTDLLVPFAALSQSGLADAFVVAPTLEPIELMPALRIRPQLTLADFDRAHSEGADYVIVPALHHEDATPVLDWIKMQSRQGAMVVGVCAGAKVLGRAGLLDHHRATTHWAYVAALSRAHPTMTWVRDRRYVVDPGVVTTTGVSASLPMSLALVEAIGGRAAADDLAAELGVASFDARHNSAAFSLSARTIAIGLANRIEFWNHEKVGVPVADGVDEIALGFTCDCFSRTYRSRAVTLGLTSAVRTRHGLELLVDQTEFHAGPLLAPPAAAAPARSLDSTLSLIANRYGSPTAAFVALQLEYPWPPVVPT
jgi:putative intracellular protease/amidase